MSALTERKEQMELFLFRVFVLAPVMRVHPSHLIINSILSMFMLLKGMFPPMARTQTPKHFCGQRTR
jgi:hypothetical protein